MRELSVWDLLCPVQKQQNYSFEGMSRQIAGPRNSMTFNIYLHPEHIKNLVENFVALLYAFIANLKHVSLVIPRSNQDEKQTNERGKQI